VLTNSETKLLHALKSRAGREKHSAFVVEGVRVVEDALAAHFDLNFAVVSPTLEDSLRGKELLDYLAANTAVRRVSDAELRKLAETETPQGVIIVAKTPRKNLSDVRLSSRALIVVLDAVQDPGNLGTIIRSADAFAAAGVIALPGTVDYWNPKVVRSAAGSSFHVPLVSADDEQTWAWLRTNEFLICGADMNGSNDIPSANGRIALVVGNEGAGLRKQSRAHIAHTLAIPMPGRAESLNVAVAAGILLYELTR
jgi:RNA methyltransferase, TrmH family